MIKRMSVLILFTLTFVTFVFTSCDEDPAKSVEENIEAAGDYLLADIAFFDVYRIIDKAARDSVLQNQGSAMIDSANITLLPNDAGMSIDYGSSNVLCPDGKLRRGTINVAMNGDYLADSSEITVSFIDFFYEDYGIEGTQSMKNLGKNSMDEWEVSLDVSNGKVVTDEGDITLATSKTLAWLQGYDTPENPDDDVFSILNGGNVSGSSRKGTIFNVNITESLVYRKTCQWIESGKMDMALTGLLIESGTVDFGDGTCDPRILLIFGGVEVPFYLD